MTRPGPDDPEVIAKAEARKTLNEARLARQAEKERLRQEAAALALEALRQREEDELAAALAREAEQEAQEQAIKAARLERASLAVLSLADQKAVRDARYAARKARQKRA